MKKYRSITLGGTFDHLHRGHIYLLEKALECADQLKIGLTTEAFVKGKQFPDSLQSYETRRKQLLDLLVKESARVVIHPLDDQFGFSLHDKELDSILVTDETKHNAEEINRIRTERGLKALEIIVEPFVQNKDQKSIRSTTIRSGEHDREGFYYDQLFIKDLQLPETLRDTLRTPLGEVMESTEKLTTKLKSVKPVMVVSVGDIVTKSLEEAGILPHLSVIDLKSRRAELSHNTSTLVNNPGTLNAQTIEKLKDLIHKPTDGAEKLIVKGEEDLLALPAILFAPLESCVVYGLFDKGIVMVKVDEDSKKQVVALIKQFTPVPSEQK